MRSVISIAWKWVHNTAQCSLWVAGHCGLWSAIVGQCAWQRPVQRVISDCWAACMTKAGAACDQRLLGSVHGKSQCSLWSAIAGQRAWQKPVQSVISDCWAVFTTSNCSMWSVNVGRGNCCMTKAVVWRRVWRKANTIYMLQCKIDRSRLNPQFNHYHAVPCSVNGQDRNVRMRLAALRLRFLPRNALSVFVVDPWKKVPIKPSYVYVIWTEYSFELYNRTMTCPAII